MINDAHISKFSFKQITKRERMMNKAWLESHAVLGFFLCSKVPPQHHRDPLSHVNGHTIGPKMWHLPLPSHKGKTTCNVALPWLLQPPFFYDCIYTKESKIMVAYICCWKLQLLWWKDHSVKRFCWMVETCIKLETMGPYWPSPFHVEGNVWLNFHNLLFLSSMHIFKVRAFPQLIDIWL